MRSQNTRIQNTAGNTAHNTVEKLFHQNQDPRAFAAGYLNYLSVVLASLDEKSIGDFISTFLYARDNEKTIYFIGNGGSASTASHFVNDITIGSKSWAKPYRAVSLCDNSAVLTAIGNDFGFEEIFSRQLDHYLLSGDVVVAISVSGNSPNIVKAIELANQRDAITVGITGFEGGRLKSLARLNVHVPTQLGEYGPAEDVHLVLNHLVASYLMQVENQAKKQELSLAKTA